MIGERLMKILIFGGTGAMGTPIVRILAEKNCQVFVTTRKSRNSDNQNIKYIMGDAHDLGFVQHILKQQRYDAIVDFMVYWPSEFKERAELFLESTAHYLFLSSSRVYAHSEKSLTEDSPRLLDVCEDAIYLATDEYALAKAREENVLFESKNKNWTIIRPYITYNTERLQLGTLEKDIWLRRALQLQSIPLPKDIANRRTTMTHGDDVAKAMTCLIGNMRAMGEAVHLTGTESMSWQEVLYIYLDVIERKTDHKAKIFMPDDSREIAEIMNNNYQIKYDRLYDRVFDNSKMLSLCGSNLQITPMKTGLTKCLEEFVRNPNWHIDARSDALFDRCIGEGTELIEFEGVKQKLKYLGWRYAPNLMKLIKTVS